MQGVQKHLAINENQDITSPEPADLNLFSLLSQPALKSVTALLLMLSFSSTAFSAAEEEIRSVALQWSEGMGLGDPDYMADLYAEDAILHGTTSPELRRGTRAIREYFARSSGSGITMFFLEPMYIRVFDDTAVNTGNYAVNLPNSDNPVTLRYSFVYHQVDGVWKIIDHHSSRLPE